MNVRDARDLRCCGPNATDQAAALDTGQAARLANTLKVLADPVRLRLLSLIARSPSGEVCACDLVDVLERSQPTISHHLKVLFEAGVLDKQRRGSWIHYSIQPDAIASVCSALGVACTPVAASS